MVPPAGKGAVLIEIAVEPDDLMARFEQHRHHDGADIAKVPSDQYAHGCYSFYGFSRLNCVDVVIYKREPKAHPAFMLTLVGVSGSASLRRQGMRPCSTMSSSTSLSLKVSIGRQKPSCLKASS